MAEATVDQAALIKQLTDLIQANGVDASTLMKAVKATKESGILKSAKAGKSPVHDAFRVAIAGAITSGVITWKKQDGTEANGRVLDEVVKMLTPDAEGKGLTSFMVDLGDVNGHKFAVNFVRRVKRPAKAKAKESAPNMGDAAPANGSADPTAEPALA